MKAYSIICTQCEGGRNCDDVSMGPTGQMQVVAREGTYNANAEWYATASPRWWRGMCEAVWSVKKTERYLHGLQRIHA